MADTPEKFIDDYKKKYGERYTEIKIVAEQEFLDAEEHAGLINSSLVERYVGEDIDSWDKVQFIVRAKAGQRIEQYVYDFKDKNLSIICVVAADENGKKRYLRVKIC